MRPFLFLLAISAPAVSQASEVYVPTRIVTAGNEVVVPINVRGGEQIRGASLDVAVIATPGVEIVGTFGESLLWPEELPFVESPPTPALPAVRSVLNFGVLSGSAAAEGTLGSAVVAVPADTPPGVFVVLPNAGLSQLNDLSDELVQAGTTWQPGLVIVIPAVEGEQGEFVTILAELIRLWLFRQFGFPIF